MTLVGEVDIFGSSGKSEAMCWIAFTPTIVPKSLQICVDVRRKKRSGIIDRGQPNNVNWTRQAVFEKLECMGVVLELH